PQQAVSAIETPAPLRPSYVDPLAMTVRYGSS
ncbi:MAG: hypothetical protein ACI9PU_002113, partial [Ascidiaceihabitans sp.]